MLGRIAGCEPRFVEVPRSRIDEAGGQLLGPMCTSATIWTFCLIPRSSRRRRGCWRHADRLRNRTGGGVSPVLVTAAATGRLHVRRRLLTLTSAIRTLVVGCGHMGASHARAYHRDARLRDRRPRVARRSLEAQRLNAELGGGYAEFSTYADALAQVKPDAVCISTYSDTHADYAVDGDSEAGAHVFLEKPVADTIADAERVIAAARRTKRALVVGYILQVHPSWQKFTEIARTLGTPLVMRMNLNQQSAGAAWEHAQAAAAQHVADRRLRRALRRRDVPHDRRATGSRQRHRRAPRGRHRARADQLRPPAGDVRRWIGRLVRGGLGPDDERDRVLREGRHRPEGQSVSIVAHARGAVGPVGRHRIAHEHRSPARSSRGARRRRVVRAR